MTDQDEIPITLTMKTSGLPILVLLVSRALAADGQCEACAADGRQVETASHEPVEPEEPGWQTYFRRVAAEYTITIGGTQTRPAMLRQQPIMKWSQPVRGGDDGAVFLWLDGPRPAAIGAIFIWPDALRGKGLTHEFQSLSERPLKAVWKQRTWTPPVNSVQWKPMPGASAFGASPRQRDLEVRRLAARFTAFSKSREGQTWQLRLLPQPVYRYEADQAPALGRGALFGFVEGTDLETVLLLETRAASAGLRWHFACARMSDYGLAVQCDGKTVWEVDSAQVDDFDGAYCGSIVEYLHEPPAVQPPLCPAGGGG
jgi:hypothetical protein